MFHRLQSTAKWIAAAALLAALPESAAAVGEKFSATAEFESQRTLGTSRIAFSLVVDRVTSPEEAQELVNVLEKGGQGMLRSALAGRRDGRALLGAVEVPVNVIVVHETEDGGRIYSVITDRPLRRSQHVGEDDSAMPFGVLRFEVNSAGSGEGFFHAATGIRLDENGDFVLSDPLEPGKLIDIRREN